MSYKYKSTIVVILCSLAMLISGCDRHKAERAELGQKIAAIEAELVPMNEEQSRISQEVDSLAAEVQKQSDALQPHLDKRTKLQDELAVFVEEHKTTALVLKMTKTGVATVLESNANQKTKTLISTADAIGKLVAVAYCLKKGQECRNATIKIMALGTQIDAENSTISTKEAQLEEAKASLQERQQKNSSLTAAIAAKTQERDGMKERLVSIS